MTDYEERRHDAVMMRLLGAPAKSVAAWLSEIGKAEQAGRPVPTWDELEHIAPSLPIDQAVLVAPPDLGDSELRHGR